MCVYTCTHRDTQTHTGIGVGLKPEPTTYRLSKLLNISERKNIFVHTIAYIKQDSAQDLTLPGVREN